MSPSFDDIESIDPHDREGDLKACIKGLYAMLAEQYFAYESGVRFCLDGVGTMPDYERSCAELLKQRKDTVESLIIKAEKICAFYGVDYKEGAEND